MTSFAMLAQLRPGDTNAVSVYSPPASAQTEIKSINICNTAATPQKFRIFFDNDGTTYDESTALFWDTLVSSDTTIMIEAGWWLTKSTGNLAVRTDLASAFTFTVFGAENNI